MKESSEIIFYSRFEHNPKYHVFALDYNGNASTRTGIAALYQTTGIICKKVIQTQLLTNYRIIQTDEGNPTSLSVFLKDLDDILVMNQHRESQSTYTSNLTRGGYTRVGFGNARSRSNTIGDVVFLYQGRPIIMFSQISDPQGVARLAKAARKRVLEDRGDGTSTARFWCFDCVKTILHTGV